MTFNEYQEKARVTARYPKIGAGFVYPALGLAGETGEVLEKVKKIMRDENGVVSEEKKREIIKELGDVLWYVSQIAFELGASLEEVATANVSKLADRDKRNAIKGSGDNR